MAHSLFGKMKTVHNVAPDVVGLEKTAKLLKVDERADLAAEREQPPTNAFELDVNERAFAHHCLDLQRAQDEPLRNGFAHLRAEQEQYAEKCDDAWFDESREKTQQDLDAQKMGFLGSLSEACVAEQQARRERKAFQNTHKVGREARYPASSVLHLAWLLFPIVFETVANAYFFALGNPLGLLGGAIQATLFSFVNVGLSFLLGVILRGLNGRRMHFLLSVVASVLFAALLMTYHLLLGHYRTALGGEHPELAAKIAIAAFIQSPFGLYDLETWLLVIVSMLFGAMAVANGYTVDDPLPGYGEVTRRYKAAEEKYRILKEAYLSGIQAVLDTQLKSVDEVLGEANTAMRAYRTNVEEGKRLVRSYAAVSAAIADAYVALVRRYRATNESIRNTPSPAYFREEPRLLSQGENINLYPREIEDMEKVANGFEQRRDLLANKAGETKKQIRLLCESYLRPCRRTSFPFRAENA